MSEVRTSLGEVFTIERTLPPLGWSPKTRGLAKGSDFLDFPDFDADDLFGVVIGLVVVVIAVAILIPVLLFVAEVALIVALVIPLTILALVLGLKQHTVSLIRKADGIAVDRREVRGVYGSIKATRELRAAAQRGAYPLKSAGVPSAAAPGSIGPPR